MIKICGENYIILLRKYKDSINFVIINQINVILFG